MHGKRVWLLGAVVLLGCGESVPPPGEAPGTLQRSSDAAWQIDRLLRTQQAQWDLAHCVLHAQDLQRLAREELSRVRVLRLGAYSGDTVPDWQWLQRFSHLEELYLGQVPLDDHGLEVVGRLSALRVLNAGRADGVSDRGLQALARLEQLELLRLVGSRIGPSGLRAVARLPRLKALILDEVPLDRRAWRVLREMGQLDSLYLYRTGLSEEELAELQEVVPHVHW